MARIQFNVLLNIIFIFFWVKPLFAQLIEPTTYCVNAGGMPQEMTMLDSHHKKTEYRKVFCLLQFESEGIKWVGLDTLASATKTLVWQVFHYSNPMPGYSPGAASPAAAYCLKQGGLTANWQNEAGEESGTCAFADGSIASDWLIFYTSARLPLVSKAFLFKESAAN